MNNLKIETWEIGKLKNWESNPRDITREGMERLKGQIKKLGVYKPLLISGDGTVLGGNMRLKAFRDLGISEVVCSVVEAGTDDLKMEYALSDNDRAGFYSLDMIKEIMPKYNIDWNQYAVDFKNPVTISQLINTEDDFYSRKIKAPIYEPSAYQPTLGELCDMKKSNELIEEIQKSDISDEIKKFLILAAYRHAVFNFSKIADYYSHADKKVQELMEKSALIIIDFEKAIENGFVKLTDEILDVESRDYE